MLVDRALRWEELDVEPDAIISVVTRTTSLWTTFKSVGNREDAPGEV